MLENTRPKTPKPQERICGPFSVLLTYLSTRKIDAEIGCFSKWRRFLDMVETILHQLANSSPLKPHSWQISGDDFSIWWRQFSTNWPIRLHGSDQVQVIHGSFPSPTPVRPSRRADHRSHPPRFYSKCAETRHLE